MLVLNQAVHCYLNSEDITLVLGKIVLLVEPKESLLATANR